ncbi:HD domain-containing protein [Brevibacillus ginsengisoli]|uniref:Ppx/GppA phosphatase family protein n=1 Tax=Brevibacillus ginsengisoli TaxID=363854 RepID=UPI003CECFF34
MGIEISAKEWPTLNKIAIIDMGSNSIRMVVFQVSEKVYHLIDDTKETVRLSENMGSDQTLKPPAIKRALATLTRFMKICRSRGVTAIFPITTAAVRQAKNQIEFLNQVERETGLRFRVLSGQEEGYYGFLGVINGFSLPSGFTLDIGGGSSEVTLFEERELKRAVSLPFGALTLHEQFKEKIGDLKLFLRKVYQQYDWMNTPKGIPLIGLGGTVRNIAKVHRHLTNYPLESAHYYEMTKAQVDETMNHLTTLTIQELQSLPGLSKDRADIIVSGGLIIQMLMEVCHAPSLYISGNGLREGLFYEHYFGPREVQSGKDVTMADVTNTMQYYNVDMEHSRHVAFLSERLFDHLKPIHKMGESERQLLFIAAHLHDVGVAVSYYEWQKHTFYVLLHSKLAGLNHRERLLVAMIASFKNKKKTREWVLPYQTIVKPEDEDLVQKLSLLLLMARAFDRALSSDIVDVVCDLEEKEIKIIAKTTSQDIALELKEAKELQQKFAKVFGSGYQLIADYVNEPRFKK